MSDPHHELRQSDEESETAATPRRRGRWIVAVGVVITVVALLAMTVGFLRPAQPTGGGTGSVADLELELPAMPSGTAASFGTQQPVWTDCGDGFECADVHAPLDWQHPAEGSITLRMVKHPAESGDPVGTLFVNPGGPGASGADFVRNGVDYAVGKPLRETYDVIGWDPRGVGGSSAVHCFDTADMDEYLFGLGDPAADYARGSDEWIAAAERESAVFGEACEQRTGALLGFVGTDSTVHDLEMLRQIVGDPQLNYLGYSYGTYIGARYADAYPELAGRLVLDGAMDPATSQFDVVREQTRGFEAALRSYAQSCLASRQCPLSGTVDEAMSEIGDLLARVDEQPLIGSDGRAVSSGTLLTAIVTPLYSHANWPYLDTLFEEVQAGKADVALALADSYFGRVDGRYADNSTEAFSAINCLDYPTSVDVDRMRREAAELIEIAPTIGPYQGYGDVSCAGWPVTGAPERGGVRAEGADPILVVGTTGDPATPYRWAVSLADQLDSGMLLTYVGEGHTAYGENACVNAAIEAYMLEGALPQPGLRCT